MKKLFQVNADLLGEGKIIFEWSSKGNFLAACGSKVRAGRAWHTRRGVCVRLIASSAHLPACVSVTNASTHARRATGISGMGLAVNPSPPRAAQRKVNILDRNGRLYDEIHFPPAELPTGDARAPAVVHMQASARARSEPHHVSHDGHQGATSNTCTCCHRVPVFPGAAVGPGGRAAGHAAQRQHLSLHLVGHQQGAAEDRDGVQGALARSLKCTWQSATRASGLAARPGITCVRVARTQTPQEMTALAWSKNGLYLSVGTAKGNLIIYNR